jgi:hypothetical protein
MTSNNTNSTNVQGETVSTTEMILIALPFFAAFVVVAEDLRVNKKQ